MQSLILQLLCKIGVHCSNVLRYLPYHSSLRRYTGGDLAQLVLEAGVTCIREQSDLLDLEEDELPMAQMRKIRVRQKDLLQAMGNTNPSSLREKSVEVRFAKPLNKLSESLV